MNDSKEIIKEEIRQIEELTSKIDFEAENAKYIKQGDYGVTYGGDDRFVLGTTQLSSCVAVAFYCEELNLAALSHVDFRTNIQSLSKVLNFFPSKKIDCYLYGGSSTHENMRKALLSFLKEKPNIHLKAKTFNKLDFIDLLSGCLLNEDSEFISKNILSLAINAKNGKIYTGLVEENFDNGLINLNSIYLELQPRIFAQDCQEGTLPLTEAFCSLPPKLIINEEPQLEALKEILEIFLTLHETASNRFTHSSSKNQSFFSESRKNIVMSHINSEKIEKIRERAKKILAFSSDSSEFEIVQDEASDFSEFKIIQDEVSKKLLKAIVDWDESALNSVREELKEMKDIAIDHICTIL